MTVRPIGSATFYSSAGLADDDRPRDLRCAARAGIRPADLIAASRHARVYVTNVDGQAAILKVATEATMDDPIGRTRFAREGRVGLVLRHPHLVATLRCGEDWILLEDLRGPDGRATSLLERIRDAGPLGVAEVERRVAAVAGALAHMHARGLVHRDIKPGNILTGPDDQPVVIDLGAVGFIAGDDLDGAELIGSPAWMAPEQIDGSPAHASADVWALAMVAATALCARTAYPGTATDVLRRRKAGGGPDPGFMAGVLEQLRGVADSSLQELILAGLCDDARARPPMQLFARLGPAR